MEHHGSSAQAELEALNPADEATKALGAYAKASLFQSLESVAREHVYAGWASVYGFVPGDGSVNFDKHKNRIAVYREMDGKWTDEWFPIGIAEPFIFAATGSCLNIAKVARP